MVKNWKVGTKLFAIVVVPIIALLALTYIGVQDRRAVASQAGRVGELTQFAAAAQDLATQIEYEGVYSVAYMASSNEVAGTELEEQRKKTDAALAEFNAQRDAVRPAEEGPLVADQLQSAEQRLKGLPTNRRSVDESQTDPTNTIETYVSTAKSVVDLNGTLAESIEEPELARLFQSFVNAERVTLAVSEQAMFATALTQAGFFPAQSAWPKAGRGDVGGSDGTACDTPDDSCPSAAGLLAAQDRADLAATVYESQATPEQKQKVRDTTAGTRFDESIKALSEAAGSDSATLETEDDLAADVVLERSIEIIGSYRTVEDQLLSDTQAKAAQLQDEANREATIFVAIALGAVGVAIAGAILVARATTGPLRKLTSAAYTLSTEKLPALVERLRNPESAEGVSLRETLTPIDIDSKDEIGQLADAFNSIQQVTIEVAEEQSVLLRKGIGDIFINLARRNQTLLDRQIEFIDQLEANEEDPDQLDNLFKLDHLATRMRRNAESLLVLAGAEPPRRRGRPVALADVVRVAIGEVEDFARIQLLALDDATVGGNVAVDLAHLLSELMENATHFSPPDTMVEVVGHRGENGTYIISVSDQGIGMSADQLGEANHQLANPPLVGLALSRSLGFIVVGRLAQRFDIDVKLTASPAGGVTGLVTLPSDVVTFEGDDEAPVPEAAAPVDEAPVEEPEVDEIIIVDEVEVEDEVVIDESGGDLLDDLLDESALEVPTDEEFDRGLQELVEEETAAAAPIEDATLAEPEVIEPEPEPVTAPEPEAAPDLPPGITVAEQIAMASRAEAKTADMTAAGLVKRTPKKRSEAAVGGGAPQMPARTTGASQRSPEEVRKMLSRYRSGLNRGRTGGDEGSDGES